MVIWSFAIAGVIVTLGFLGNYIFKKTGIPDTLILIVFGLALGPIFNVVDVSSLSSITPIFASLALLIILFDGGLHLPLYKVLQESSKAMLLAALGVLTSMLGTALFTHYLLNWDILHGLLLGAIIGGSSSSIVIPLITRMKVKTRISTLLSLESAFTDAIVIVVGITLLNLLTTSTGSYGISSAAQSIASEFSIGALMGIVVGVVWLRILRIIKREIYDDILTLSIVLMLYSVVESLGGNGAIFALVFGLVLGNGREISTMFKMKDSIQAGKIMKKFMSQISFFIRTFFFVYLGLILTIGNYSSVFYGVILSVILLSGRYIVSFAVSAKDNLLKKNRLVITTMLPRGLAAAVMAQLVITSTAPNVSTFPDTVIVVIISTVIISTIGAFIVSKKAKTAIENVPK